MNKKDINKILHRINKIKKELEEIELILYSYKKPEDQRNPKLGTSLDGVAQDSLKRVEKEEEAILAWQHFIKEVSDSKNPEGLIKNFVSGKNKKELRDIIRANNLPLNPKDSKEKIMYGIIQLLRISNIIKKGGPL